MTWTPGQPVALETERLRIRSLAPADISDRMLAWFADPEVMRYVTLPMNMTRPQMLKLLEGFDNRTNFLLGIFLKETGEPIGLHKVACDRVNLYGVTTTMIGDKGLWGKGTSFEARTAITDFMFERVGLRKMVGRVYGPNTSAMRVNEKLGYRREGVLRRHERDRAGQWQDIHLFGLLREEWRAHRAAQGNPAIPPVARDGPAGKPPL